MSASFKGSGLTYTKKSTNFDRNKDPVKMGNQGENNVYKIASVNLTTARQKYTPIATRRLINSLKIKKVSNDKIELSSLNYSNSWHRDIDRYHDSTPNKEYKTKSGNIIGAGRNAGKFRWFQKAFEKNRKVNRSLMKKDVIK